MSTQTSSPSLLALLRIPAFAWLAFILKHYIHAPWFLIVAAAALILAVLSAVHHAETIAHRIGEPFGALVLALAVTIIEVSIIISLMQAGGSEVSALARDTVFSAVMIILTGMTGLTLLIGGLKYREQEFGAEGVNSILTVLVAISVLTLILPNFTETSPGPYYTNQQLIFVAIIAFLLYASFLFVQNFRHKEYFVAEGDQAEGMEKPTRKESVVSIVLLPVCLLAVVMLAESMAPDLEAFIDRIGAPRSLAGIIIACVILLPEGVTAVKAAAANKMQRSLNLSLGSALASISLTIPVVAVYSILTNTPIALGIGHASSVLFMLALIVVIMSLSKGRTTILQGIVLLLIFLVYLFITINP